MHLFTAFYKSSIFPESDLNFQAQMAPIKWMNREGIRLFNLKCVLKSMLQQGL